jgi:hypothetical protein
MKEDSRDLEVGLLTTMTVEAFAAAVVTVPHATTNYFNMPKFLRDPLVSRRPSAAR